MSSMKKKNVRGGTRGEVVSIPRDRLGGDTIIKRMTKTATITSNGAGNCTFTVKSSDVQSSPATEWASFAARYVSYRVLKIKVTLVPLDSANTVFTGSQMIGLFLAEDPSGIASVTTENAIAALKRVKLYANANNNLVKFVANASEEDHLLWTETTIVIPTTGRYQIWGFSNTGAVSHPYYFALYEWIVELRGSQ